MRSTLSITSYPMSRVPVVDTEKHPNVSVFSIDVDFIKQAQEVIESSNNSMPEFWRRKYELENSKNWDMHTLIARTV